MSKVLKNFLTAATVGALLFTAACTTRNTETTTTTPSGGDTTTSAEATTGGEAAGGEFTVAFVPKIQGIPYFEAMNTGGKAAEAEIEGLTWMYQGPTTADPAAQADIVRSMIQKKVDVLIVAPNDPDSLAPILQEAKDAGIKVGTSDTDAPNSVREVFVEQATSQAIGEYTADTLAKAMGEKGTAVIVSCGETAENLNSWIKIEEETFASKYPDIKLLPTVYAGEDQNKATQMATDLMNANPDLNGIIGQCTTSAPGVAQAVRDAGKIGQVFTVGVGTPQAMLPYLEDGSSSGSILWDVENLGYLTAWAGAQLFQGKAFEATNQVSDKIKDVEFRDDTKELILGPPLVLTKDNAGQFNY
ncbi:autoinducer 2 ABC transporter substrate-binding protein [Tessaracoccus flavescens]|uniref:Sugar ABC transporter substrate-binding protein n=1 Tax=Tessaracoccus flavescens TaxID=399497 RepID=A0A1Q2CVH3_9ACTN|nr:autoinducer 2 ABC transporter substrate-binding protein [Tessaracoccus flavescens]AQP50087.1 sugar ABC transporter substrate-binding protein [Tessaracoccus flavescens]